MAQQPARIVWSQEAVAAFKQLDDRTRDLILRRVGLLEQMPMLFQVEPNGRWAGLRRFRSRTVIVFYTYWHEDHSVYVETIVPARADRG